MNTNKPQICVAGSANYDLIAYTDRLPKLGETIHGSDFKMGFGGKGANQAAIAAKLGADVTMITKLGEDIFGKQTIENFKKLKINTEHVYFTDKAPSGVAPISVDKKGNNSIIVVAGANNLLTEDEIELARDAVSNNHILICQNEILLNVTIKALKVAKEEGVKTIFNPAPAPTEKLPDEIFKYTDIFCPNETETELLTGMPVHSNEEAEKAGRTFLEKGVSKVIITLGSRGSMLISKDKTEFVPANKVEAFDTTGAGDCFLGSFAYFSALGFSDYDAIKKANYVASVSVQKSGTQTSFPLYSELPKDLFI